MADPTNARIKITQPCVVIGADGTRFHAEEDQVVTVSMDDAMAIVSAGRGVLSTDDERPSARARRAAQE